MSGVWAPRIVAVVLVVLAFALPLLTWDALPEEIPSHWNAAGEVDGYMTKGWGTLLMPSMMLVVTLLMWAVPLIDPLRANIETFRTEYEWFIVLMDAFLLVIQGQIIAWALGYEISPNAIIPVAIGVLFIYIGWMLRRARRNFFVGIRTPWTLMSDEVWDKTHRLGGVLFMLAGLVTLVGVFFEEHVVWFTLAPVLAATLVTIVYSYVEYQRVGPDDPSGPPPATN